MPPEIREAIDSHETEVVDRSWDGDSVRASIDNDSGAETLEEYHAWRDPEGDPETKDAYSFIHHHRDADAGEAGAANLTACQTGIAVLNGARGVDPGDQPWSDDRQQIWDHLADHIRDWADENDEDLEPPELEELSRRENVVSIHTHRKSDAEKYVRSVQEQNDGLERRVYNQTAVRAEEGDDDEESRIEGEAAVFDEPTVIRGLFGKFKEVVRDTFFDETLARGWDVRALFNHDPDHILGRVNNDTLELRKTDDALEYTNFPPETNFAGDLVETIKRGDIPGNSFSFEVFDDNWTEDDEGIPMRELLSGRTYDVGPVTFPAYSATSVSARGALSHIQKRAGADLQQLAEAIGRLKRGGEDPQSRKTIEEFISDLEDLISTEPSGEAHRSRWLRLRKQQSRLGG